MRYAKKCEQCGHMETAYLLPLNISLVKAFVAFAEKYRGIGLKKGEIGLTNAQYSNFQNLRHFGIIQQFDQKWHLTEKGRAFYLGEIALTTPVAHMGGKTLPNNHEAWLNHDDVRETKLIHDIFPIRYKQRDEYRQEKHIAQLSLKF